MLALFDTLMTHTDHFIDHMIFEGYHHFAEIIWPWASAAVGLSVAIFGWCLLQGLITTPFKQACVSALVLGVVLTLMHDWNTVSAVLVRGFYEGPMALTQQLMAASTHPALFGKEQVDQALQVAFDQGMQLSLSVMLKAHIYHLSPLVYGVAIALVSFGICGLAMAYLIMAKLGLAVGLVMTPFFA